MPDYVVSTVFKGQDKITPVFSQMAKGADKFGNKASNAFKKASREGSRFKDITKGILAADIVKTGAIALKNSIADVVNTASEMEGIQKSFQTVFNKNAAKEISFVKEEADRLGLALKSTSKGYIALSASAKGTVIEGKSTKEVFKGIVEASTALGLSSDKTEGAILAVSQMMSKGKVQAEELRGQLGERIPGAFQIAARAMGMTTQELDKFMSLGKLTAEKFIPKFATQLRKEFGKAADDSSKSFKAMRNRFNNLTLTLKDNIGNIIVPSIIRLTSFISPIIKKISDWTKANRELIQLKIKSFIDGVKDAFTLVKPILSGVVILFKSLLPILTTFAPIFPVLVTGMLAYNIALKAQLALGAIKHFITFASTLRSFAAVQAVITALWAANPLGFVVTAVFVVIGALTLLQKKFKIFTKIGDFFGKFFGKEKVKKEVDIKVDDKQVKAIANSIDKLKLDKKMVGLDVTIKDTDKIKAVEEQFKKPIQKNVDINIAAANIGDIKHVDLTAIKQPEIITKEIGLDITIKDADKIKAIEEQFKKPIQKNVDIKLAAVNMDGIKNVDLTAIKQPEIITKEVGLDVTIKDIDKIKAVEDQFKKPIQKNVEFKEVVKSAFKPENIESSGVNIEAPNKAEVKARQEIAFNGQLNINGAPKGSTFESKTVGAPEIKVSMLGENI